MTAGDQTIQIGYIGGLARRLINEGLLSESVARDAQARAAKERVALVHWVVTQNMASALDVGMAASREFGLSLLDLNAMNMEAHVLVLLHFFEEVTLQGGQAGEGCIARGEVRQVLAASPPLGRAA